MANVNPANDNGGATPAEVDFDYSAPAEVFLTQSRARRRATRYRRFPTAAEAIRFAVEENASTLVGAVMEVRERRFDHKGIRALYAREDYPLPRH